jgi:hypothetical protein
MLLQVDGRSAADGAIIDLNALSAALGSCSVQQQLRTLKV